MHPPLYYILGKVAVTIGAAIRMDSLHSLRLLSIIPHIIILIISATKIRKGIWFSQRRTVRIFTSSHERVFRTLPDCKHVQLGSPILTYYIHILYRNYQKRQKSLDYTDSISILCIYTHYFAAISAACIYLILLTHIIKFEKDEPDRWAMSIGAALILFIL
ncbi:hypothetical protein [Methanobrevibacter sp.]|uniref:hypothetical protein n=1 Tax=Methanobrevibacter sp. TaxID=66852 RepID=UPI002E77471D|nr:hypothetical protein [Methanobrevibacter sp.]MEE0938324.1 hypothetical protein [Methanobrevibacter sp.]